MPLFLPPFLISFYSFLLYLFFFLPLILCFISSFLSFHLYHSSTSLAPILPTFLLLLPLFLFFPALLPPFFTFSFSLVLLYPFCSTFHPPLIFFLRPSLPSLLPLSSLSFHPFGLSFILFSLSSPSLHSPLLLVLFLLLHTILHSLPPHSTTLSNYYSFSSPSSKPSSTHFTSFALLTPRPFSLSFAPSLHPILPSFLPSPPVPSDSRGLVLSSDACLLFWRRTATLMTPRGGGGGEEVEDGLESVKSEEFE